MLTGRPGWILVDVSAGRREEVDAILEDVSALPEAADEHDYVGLKTVKDEASVLPGDRLSANVPCFECQGPIRGDPVKVRLDGRYHYFCCHYCERLYLEKHGRIQDAALNRA